MSVDSALCVLSAVSSAAAETSALSAGAEDEVEPPHAAKPNNKAAEASIAINFLAFIIPPSFQ